MHIFGENSNEIKDFGLFKGRKKIPIHADCVLLWTRRALPLTPRRRCGHSGGGEQLPWCRLFVQRCAARGDGLFPSYRFPGGARPHGHDPAAAPPPVV